MVRALGNDLLRVLLSRSVPRRDMLVLLLLIAVGGCGDGRGFIELDFVATALAAIELAISRVGTSTTLTHLAHVSERRVL